MKKCMLFVSLLLMFAAPVLAQSSGYGLSFGYGEADPEIDIYRVGLKKDFPAKWFKTKIGYLSGYFELSLNHWECGNQDINGIAFSPVFAYYFGNENAKIRPYIEGGIGATYLDEYRIADRNLSSNYQFEDRLGAGVRIGFVDMNFRYMHYSNASLKAPNHGIDILMFTTSIQF